MAAIEPMHQFLIKEIVHIDPVTVPGLGLVNLSITNSVMWMMIAAAAISAFFIASGRGQTVPGRLQAVGEGIYNLVDGVLVTPMIGHKGKPYLPFVLTVFTFVLTMNMLGMFVWSFTPTTQLAVTGTLALIVFLSVIIIGFVKNGANMYKLFVPGGMHWAMLLLMVPIEIISFLTRPLTLAMRLFGNMVGGHVVMYMFGSFVVSLGLLGMGGGIATLGFLGSGVSLAMVTALTALEFVVAFLQAFVFAALACVYLNEVVNLGHGH